MTQRRPLRFVTIVLVALFGVTPALAASPEDEAAIRATALDYIEGWYEGDAERMERSLHPELAKRVVITPAEGGSVFRQMGAMTLVHSTAGRSRAPADERRADVTILDVYENAASVKIYAEDWVDYLHMAKWNGEWKIVNVLDEFHPQAE